MRGRRVPLPPARDMRLRLHRSEPPAQAAPKGDHVQDVQSAVGVEVERGGVDNVAPPALDDPTRAVEICGGVDVEVAEQSVECHRAVAAGHGLCKIGPRLHGSRLQADVEHAVDDRSGTARGTPARLGDFRVIREIDRGGMGVVYEAEQESLGRRVALKVLSRMRDLSDATLQRFRVEAKAAARLHHSNIVPVFGVGEEDGVPFYVMQYIDGQGPDAVLRELRRLRAAPSAAGTPSPEPTALSQTGSPYWRSVAPLGADVGAALQHAHDSG